jgi:hypothetical protein
MQLGNHVSTTLIVLYLGQEEEIVTSHDPLFLTVLYKKAENNIAIQLAQAKTQLYREPRAPTPKDCLLLLHFIKLSLASPTLS